MKRMHRMPFGAEPDGQGGARFRFWAPAAGHVDLLIGDAASEAQHTPMQPLADGWFQADVADVDEKTLYAFELDHGLVVPDPASRCNPEGVHGRSRVVNPLAFDWPADAWRGRPWHEAVAYELHVGCFTPEGTFAAVIERLDDLVALGITAIELMPISEFAGARGWGYDGVLHYAPKAAYGSSADLKRLVVEAHRRGLMVLLDVVYNHFGPDGNYLHASAPAFFNPNIRTPWGPAINLDGEGSVTVREFFLHNALYWIEEFQLDGLRVDAVHAMHDASAPDLIAALALAIRSGPGRDRAVHLVLENELNDAGRLSPVTPDALHFADAQWNDDVHHALHVIATGETDGYYSDFATEPARLFGRALAEGFAYQGDASALRGGRAHGTPSAHLPPLAFVNSMQTHDQIGNRAFGERIAALAEQAGRTDALRALTACVLLAPSPPMLFMAEEWAAASPFLYFCDFTGDLAQAVTAGRRAEFGRFERFADPALRDSIADPNDPASFARSKLDWAQRTQQPHAQWLAFYTDLLRRRHEHLIPQLAGARSGQVSWPAPHLLRLTWPLSGGVRWHMQALLADDAMTADAAAALPGDEVYRSHAFATMLPPWAVCVTVEVP